jgi:hypothetical protein
MLADSLSAMSLRPTAVQHATQLAWPIDRFHEEAEVDVPDG